MKQVQKISYFALGLVVALVISSVSPALAATLTKQVSIVFRDIKLVVDGVSVTPKDAAGNVVEPFVFEGTTYLPVRALADALGKPVEWDGATSTIYVGLKNNADNYLVDVIKPYAVGKFYYEFPSGTSTIKHHGEDISMVMGGKQYYRGFALGDPSYVVFNLDGKFSSLSGIVGLGDYNNKTNGHVSIIGDGRVIAEYDFAAESLPRTFSINVTGVLQLKIEKSNGNFDVCFADVVLN